MAETETDAVCFLCGRTVEIIVDQTDWRRLRCPRCGDYEITGSAEAAARRCLDASECTHDGDCLGPAIIGDRGRRRANASAYLQRHSVGRITTAVLKRLARISTPSFADRLDQLLLSLERRTAFGGQWVDVRNPVWLSLAWALNSDELLATLEYLQEARRVQVSFAGEGTTKRPTSARIVAGGWERLEHLRETNGESGIVFVAMRFSERMFDVLDSAIRPAVEAAGFEARTVRDYVPRAGEAEYTEDIVARILMLIRRSRLVIADFTEHSDGVYFEAGFARGLGRPVIWTAQEGSEPKPHFDTNHFEHIFWKDETDLEGRLRERIEAIVGAGPLAASESQSGGQ